MFRMAMDVLLGNSASCSSFFLIVLTVWPTGTNVKCFDIIWEDRFPFLKFEVFNLLHKTLSISDVELSQNPCKVLFHPICD